MIPEFANSDDIQDYVDMRNLVKVEFDESLFHYRIAILHFDDDTYIRLNLEDCHKLKIWKWTWYEGSLIVKNVNGSKANYELKFFDVPLRNFLIDGIALEEQRLKDAWSEEFTNAVRGENTKKYDHKTIINGVEFVKNKNIV